MNCKNTHGYIAQPSDTEQELEEELQESIDQIDSEFEDIEYQSSDEEARLLELNRDVDNTMEEVFGVPF